MRTLLENPSAHVANGKRCDDHDQNTDDRRIGLGVSPQPQTGAGCNARWRWVHGPSMRRDSPGVNFEGALARSGRRDPVRE